MPAYARRPMWRSLPTLAAIAPLVASAAVLDAQPKLTSPKEFFGHEIGADYVLPNYTRFLAYWSKLATESDRMVLDTIGTTAEGRPQVMAIITSPANHGRLARYQEIARRLALAEGLTDAEARALAAEGKAVVWIDGGLHATEVLGAQQLLETVWQLVSGSDPETTRFLDDLIILGVHANPDGMELVSDWYMRESTPARRSTSDVPRLYQKYIGHDNNRDFYMSTQPETENMNRVMYLEWFPQIMYNHHQTGPTGTVMFAPPFRDPANYNVHPLIITGLDVVGSAMHNRFVSENKPGVTMREGANYSAWWNGGLRTTAYFHNIIGLLTETIGNPTPMRIPFLAGRQMRSADLPLPIAPQPWHFRQSVDYSVTANRAVLDVASRHREQFLYNIYLMGRDAIAAGSRDSWTVWPRRLETVRAAMAADRAKEERPARGEPQDTTGKYLAMLREPARRDPRGYIIPADQPDFGSATKFIHALQETGVRVHRATRAFEVTGRRYPAGSYVVKTAQAFRPHVLDMFEPQDHPDDIPYPGGPPKPPYDNAGWTLAYQMGVRFDRVLDAFDGPFEPLNERARLPAGTVARASGETGWILAPRANDAFLAVNRLLKEGEQVRRLTTARGSGAETHPAGSFHIAARSGTRERLERLAAELGLDFAAATTAPVESAAPLRQPRIALWDRYGGSMPSGWTRWILEQFEFPYEVVYTTQLDAGNLRAKYDVLVLVDGAIAEPREDDWDRAPDSARVPRELRDRLGRITTARTVPKLREFLEGGGTILTIGSSTALGRQLGLPLGDALVERTATGNERTLPRDKYYVPGSLLEVAVDTASPLAYGMADSAIVMFDNSPVFRLRPDAALAGVRPVAWFDSAAPLRSGWAWGQGYLEGGVAIAEATVGRGTLVLYGPEVLFRAQPHGTFKLFFNALHRAPANGARERAADAAAVGARTGGY